MQRHGFAVQLGFLPQPGEIAVLRVQVHVGHGEEEQREQPDDTSRSEQHSCGKTAFNHLSEEEVFRRTGPLRFIDLETTNARKGLRR